MKLADLQLAMQLQAALARLDEIPAGCALLEANGLDIELTADELASFVDWRRADLHRQLRALGVDAGDAGDQGSGIRYQEISDREAARLLIDGPAVEINPGGRGSAPSEGNGSPAPRPPTNRAEVVRRATDAVMTAASADLARGEIDQETFDEWTRRRAPQIHDLADQMMRGEAVARCHCGSPATTTIADVPLCDEHAAAAPRRERPKLLQRLLG